MIPPAAALLSSLRTDGPGSGSLLSYWPVWAFERGACCDPTWMIKHCMPPFPYHVLVYYVLALPALVTTRVYASFLVPMLSRRTSCVHVLPQQPNQNNNSPTLAQYSDRATTVHSNGLSFLHWCRGAWLHTQFFVSFPSAMVPWLMGFPTMGTCFVSSSFEGLTIESK